jgi:hypothetical protein
MMLFARKRLLEPLRVRLGGMIDQEETRFGPGNHLDGHGPQGAPPDVVHMAFAHSIVCSLLYHLKNHGPPSSRLIRVISCHPRSKRWN